MKIPERLLRQWRASDARALPGVDSALVGEAFGKLGMRVSLDVLSLYQAIGGMQILDARDWRLWPLAEVESQSAEGTAFGAEFSDYLAGCWSFRVRPISLEVSEVYLDYGVGQSPVRAAASTRDELEQTCSM
jgi:hypothetical protein